MADYFWKMSYWKHSRKRTFLVWYRWKLLSMRYFVAHYAQSCNNQSSLGNLLYYKIVYFQLLISHWWCQTSSIIYFRSRNITNSPCWTIDSIYIYIFIYVYIYANLVTFSALPTIQRGHFETLKNPSKTCASKA